MSMQTTANCAKSGAVNRPCALNLGETTQVELPRIQSRRRCVAGKPAEGHARMTFEPA